MFPRGGSNVLRVDFFLAIRFAPLIRSRVGGKTGSLFIEYTGCLPV